FQLDLRLVGQALHRRRDVAELEVLGEEHAVALERTVHGERRLESADAARHAAEARGEVARLDLPVVGAAARADLRDAAREAAVLGGERIGEYLDRLDALRRQIEIEIAGRRIVQAGAADLQRALRRLPALDAQAAVRSADHAGEHEQQALEVV